MNGLLAYANVLLISYGAIWVLFTLVRYLDDVNYVRTNKLPYDYNRIWFTVHAIVNAFVVLFTFPDLVATLVDPGNCLITPESKVPVLIALSLHTFHIISCSRGLTLIDWIHHMISCGLVGVLQIYFLTGPIDNYTIFFICGLPGGIDYAMLALAKYGIIDRLTQKKICVKLNMYIRMPGALFGLGLMHAMVIGGDNDISMMKMAIWYITGMLTAVNTVFFAERVAVNYGEVSAGMADVEEYH